MSAGERLVFSLRKVMGFLLVGVVLAAFALPAGAVPPKAISLVVSTGTLPTGTSVITATITNEGNSKANSFEVDWSTSANFTVNSVTARGVTISPPYPQGLRGQQYQRATFNQQLPVKESV